MSENKARLDTGQVSLDIIIGSVFSRVLYVGQPGRGDRGYRGHWLGFITHIEFLLSSWVP